MIQEKDSCIFNVSNDQRRAHEQLLNGSSYRLENNENSKAGEALVRPFYQFGTQAEASFALLHLLLSLRGAPSLLNILVKSRHLVLQKHEWNDLWQSVTHKKGTSSSHSTKIMNCCVPNPYSQQEEVICIYFMLPKSYWSDLVNEKQEFVVGGEFKTWGWKYRPMTILFSNIFKNLVYFITSRCHWRHWTQSLFLRTWSHKCWCNLIGRM